MTLICKLKIRGDIVGLNGMYKINLVLASQKLNEYCLFSWLDGSFKKILFGEVCIVISIIPMFDWYFVGMLFGECLTFLFSLCFISLLSSCSVWSFRSTENQISNDAWHCDTEIDLTATKRKLSCFHTYVLKYFGSQAPQRPAVDSVSWEEGPKSCCEPRAFKKVSLTSQITGLCLWICI